MKAPRFIGCVITATAMLAIGASAGAQQAPQAPQAPRAPAPAEGQGWLGIAFRYTHEPNGRQAEEQAVISQVHPGSPAMQAGLRAGDMIVQVNRRSDVEATIRALRLQPGDTVRLRVRRQGERARDLALVAQRRPAQHAARERTRVVVPGREAPGTIIINGDTVRIPMDSVLAHVDSLQRRFRVLIADSLGPRLRELEDVHMPELRERLRTLDTALVRAFPDGFVFEVGRRAVAGAEFSELNPELAEYFHGVREGLLVLRVAPQSPAARAGLQAGDVVVRANGEVVRNTADLRRIVGAARNDEVRLAVVRKGRQLELRFR
jgi:S1-C subfamily serine protease